MIRATALTRRYADFEAVKGVSFEIGPREIVGLLGHNGAGKTTIMKMMTGYLEPTSGTIAINGLDVWSQRIQIQRQIGYLPENCPLYPEMRVLDYLDYVADLRGVKEEHKIDRIRYVVKKTDLISVAEQSISTLSRGYRQRLGVAQAILNAPNIVILDEPTNGLDPSQIFEMRSLIKELAESATVIVSTHILQEVQAICDRVIIVNQGLVALDAAMADLQKTDQVRLVTDLELNSCHQILEKVKGLRIVQTQRKSRSFEYIIRSEAGNISEFCASVASTLIENGCKLYELQPCLQDLETVFADITAGAAPASFAISSNDGERKEQSKEEGKKEEGNKDQGIDIGNGIDHNNGLGVSLQVAERLGVSNE